MCLKMDDCPELVLKTICCTCLSRDRKLAQLCKLPDGVNNLYLLLSYDNEAYREGFYKDSASLFICWECQALMSKVTKFRTQACSVQKVLTDITEGRTDVNLLTACLSHLSTSTKQDYDEVISDDSLDNFIDCGPVSEIKTEDDLDDVALSELHNNFISDGEELRKETEELKPKVKIKKKKKKELKNGFSANSNKVKNVVYNEAILERLLKRRKRRQLMANLVEVPFKCESCADIFNSQIELDEHNVALHSKNFKSKLQKPGSNRRRAPPMTGHTPIGYLCPECNKCFDTKNKRWKHVQRYHKEGHACHTCGKKFAFKNNLNRHEQLHKAPAPREECPHCHKQIRSDLLKVHIRIHSAREQFSCAECDKRFVSRASYDHHLKYTQAHAANTAVILKYKCSMCDKGYRSSGELRDHVNYQHMGKTQHKCPVCGKALATRRCITRHVRRAHDGVKESARDKICQQCGKAFRDKKGLREHEFIHTGERPLSCEICGCTFRQSASLYTHRKRVHKIYPQKKNVELLEAS